MNFWNNLVHSINGSDLVNFSLADSVLLLNGIHVVPDKMNDVHCFNFFINKWSANILKICLQRVTKDVFKT